jgi:hypothetical protein
MRLKRTCISFLKTIALMAVSICVYARFPVQAAQSPQSIKIGEIEFFGVGSDEAQRAKNEGQSGKGKEQRGTSNTRSGKRETRNKSKEFSSEELEQLRRALPVKEGDEFKFDSGQATFAQIKQVVRQTTGRDATDVNFLCCDDRGAAMIFIGLPGPAYRPFKYNPVMSARNPNDNPELPDEIVALVQKVGELAHEAAQKEPREDRSQGYALSLYPPFREVQLKIREYALDHAGLLHRVLYMSMDAKQKRAAVYALGYTMQTDAQLAALVWASRDRSSDVRNDATRALAVLAESDARAARRISTAHFVAMLSSGSWSDRNKAAMLLSVLTVSRNPTLLGALRKNAFEALIEMARWRSAGHAYHARMILGRMAGIEETRLEKLANQGQVDEIIGKLVNRKS